MSSADGFGKVMVMAGGTGGHVFPALAVARALQNEYNAEIVWMGTAAGLEARVIPAAGIATEWIPVAGLRGKGALSWLTAPFRVLRAVSSALSVMRRHRPRLVIGMGGFASGPGGLAARLLRLPLVVHEQNAVAGLTNRMLAVVATRVLEAFPNTFPASRKALCVGNPVRADILALAAPKARFAERTGPIRLLVIGGSLGAMSLNKRLPVALQKLSADQRPQVWHQAGRTLDVATEAYAGLAQEMGDKLRLVEFIEDMAEAYAWADVVVCRAGALTVAELAAVGLPALLVPFPHAVDDHQTRNGQYLVDAGAAQIMQESDMDDASLTAALASLLVDRQQLLTMAEAARSCAWPRATQEIVAHCLAAAGVELEAAA